MSEEHDGGGGGGAGAAAPLDAVKIRGRIHHHLRTCSAAVKKARAFEVQRTVKKLKTVTGEERKSLESQLQALKGSNHGQVAALAIKSKLVKAKLLPRTKAGEGEIVDNQYPLIEYIDELEACLKTGEGSSSAANVEVEKARARLLSNKIVSEEVSNVTKVISALLRGEEPTKQAKVGGKTKHHHGGEELQSSKRAGAGERQREACMESDQEAADASKADIDPDCSDDDDSEESSSGNVVAGYKAKPATATRLSPSAQSRKRKGGADEQDRQRPSKQLRRGSQDSESDDDDDSGRDEEAERSLPALTTGFVGGRGFNLGRGSEDEWSDGDAELESIDEDADGIASRKETRKNRMGQRARRAIWEKKFGKGANHLKLLEKEKKLRRPPPARPGQEGLPGRDAGWTGALGQNAPIKRAVVPAGPTLATKSMPSNAAAEMHPSWIAKQKQKEKEEAAARSRGAARKIVFD